MNKRYEQQLVNGIITLLTLNRIVHVHVRNTGAVIRRGDGSLTFGRSMFSQKGVPDILAWKAERGADSLTFARAYAVEVKSETGRVSPEQKEWMDRFTAIGGVSIVARKIEDVAGPMGIRI